MQPVKAGRDLQLPACITKHCVWEHESRRDRCGECGALLVSWDHQVKRNEKYCSHSSTQLFIPLPFFTYRTCKNWWSFYSKKGSVFPVLLSYIKINKTHKIHHEKTNFSDKCQLKSTHISIKWLPCELSKHEQTFYNKQHFSCFLRNYDHTYFY